MLERMCSKGSTHPLLVGMQTCATTLESSVAVTQEVGNQPTSRSSNTTLAIIPKRCPMRECAWSNGSSPKPDGPDLNEHVIKSDSLNVADNGGWLRNSTGACFYCMCWLFVPQAIWMHSFLGLDRRGRALDFPHGRVPCPLLRRNLMEESEGGAWGKWEEWMKCKFLNGKLVKKTQKIIKQIS